MADQEPSAAGNGSGAPQGDPQVATLAQYVKDLSVESPNAPQVFQWQIQPQLEVQFNIQLDRVGDDIHEVLLKIDVSARSDKGVHFLIDLSYGGLFGLRNFSEDQLPPFLLVEAPRLLFPFARQIIADASHQTGFPPLMLDPIDFAGAFIAQVQAAQSQGNGAEPQLNGGEPQPNGDGAGGAETPGGDDPNNG